MVKELFTEEIALFTGADNFLTTEFGPFASIVNIKNVCCLFLLTFEHLLGNRKRVHKQKKTFLRVPLNFHDFFPSWIKSLERLFNDGYI